MKNLEDKQKDNTSENPHRRKSDSIKHQSFKWLGSLFMVEKNGTLALSLTRCLSLVVFGFLCWRWSFSLEVDSTIVQTFWGLIGVKGMESVAGHFKK